MLLALERTSQTLQPTDRRVKSTTALTASVFHNKKIQPRLPYAEHGHLLNF